MFFTKPPLPLPKITAPTAAEICAKCNPSPQAQALLTPQMTPPEYLAALEKNKLPLDSVNFLANGLPEKDSVCWAAQASKMTAPKLSPPEANSLQLTEAWLKNPTPALKDAVGASLGKVDFTGPASWTAQAAMWTKPPAVPAMSAIPGMAAAAAPGAAAAASGAAAAVGGPVASAVAGAILLAAGLKNGPAMPPVPQPKLQVPMTPLTPEALQQLQQAKIPAQLVAPVVDQAKLVKPLAPFIDLGKNVANGSVSCA